MVFNATFNNISAISWRLVSLVGESGGPGENHRPVESCTEYTSPWARFELTTLVVIDYNCTGKSNSHTITTKTAHWKIKRNRQHWEKDIERIQTKQYRKLKWWTTQTSQKKPREWTQVNTGEHRWTQWTQWTHVNTGEHRCSWKIPSAIGHIYWYFDLCLFCLWPPLYSRQLGVVVSCLQWAWSVTFC